METLGIILFWWFLIIGSFFYGPQNPILIIEAPILNPIEPQP